VQDMYSFLTEYFSSAVLVLHAIRCRAAQVGLSQGPTDSGPREVHTTSP
jgi:hypothetical protein